VHRAALPRDVAWEADVDREEPSHVAMVRYVRSALQGTTG
jgi:hypothetical protein